MRQRRVTPLTRKRAFETIKIVSSAAMAGEIAISYSDLAERLGMPNDTGRGLGPILDEAAAMCREHDLPDVSSLIVTKASLDAGRPMPSDDSFVDGVWPNSGITKEEVTVEQERVRNFDWSKIRPLNAS